MQGFGVRAVEGWPVAAGDWLGQGEPSVAMTGTGVMTLSAWRRKGLSGGPWTRIPWMKAASSQSRAAESRTHSSRLLLQWSFHGSSFARNPCNHSFDQFDQGSAEKCLFENGHNPSLTYKLE